MGSILPLLTYPTLDQLGYEYTARKAAAVWAKLLQLQPLSWQIVVAGNANCNNCDLSQSAPQAIKRYGASNVTSSYCNK